MFEISLLDNGIVKLNGRLDAAQAPKANEVLEKLNESFTVDFTELEYISSAGLGVFLATRKRLAETGHRIKMFGMNKHVGDVFKYAGMHQIFDIE